MRLFKIKREWTKEMNSITQKILQAIVLVLILSAAGEAQDPTGLVSVQASLKRLDEQLAFANELLASFPNQEAKQYIQMAQRAHDQAQLSVASNKPLQAAVNIRTANQWIDKAINLLVTVPFKRLRERLEDLLRHAERVVPASGNKEAERLLREAQKNSNQAYKSAQAGQYRLAMEHYRVATYLCERAIDVAVGPQGNLAERLAKERERFEELLDRARTAAFSSSNQTANQLLTKSRTANR